jgi:hypothetical protein
MTEERSMKIIQEAAMIFEGLIVNMDVPDLPEENFEFTDDIPVTDNPIYAELTLKILETYKGKPEGKRIRAYADVVTSCGQRLQTSDTLLFVLTQRDTELVKNNSCKEPLQTHIHALKQRIAKD